MHISALYRYPVKSLGGQRVARARVEPTGLDGDRRWMIVDPAGHFLTRRQIPDLARIEARPVAGGIVLHHCARDDGAARADVLPVPCPPACAPDEPVRIWSDTVTAQAAGAAADAWLSTRLGRPVRLVFQADHCPRPVSPKHGAPGDRVSFADGYPLLITTEESLADLSERIGEPVAMERFRPNIVLAGAAAPWAEDGWRRLRIGDLTLRLVKPCVRCIVTTQDPRTGATLGDGREPLRTLRRMGRRTKSGVVFGVNAIPDPAGQAGDGGRAFAPEIAVGDPVELLESGPSPLTRPMAGTQPPAAASPNAGAQGATGATRD